MGTTPNIGLLASGLARYTLHNRLVDDPPSAEQLSQAPIWECVDIGANKDAVISSMDSFRGMIPLSTSANYVVVSTVFQNIIPHLRSSTHGGLIHILPGAKPSARHGRRLDRLAHLLHTFH
jgi:hypothetical protein